MAVPPYTSNNVSSYYYQTGQAGNLASQSISNRNAALALTQIGSYNYIDHENGAARQIRFVRPAGQFSIQAQIFNSNSTGLGDLLSTVPGHNIFVRRVFNTSSLTTLDPNSQDSLMRSLDSYQGGMNGERVTIETEGGTVARLYISSEW